MMTRGVLLDVKNLKKYFDVGNKKILRGCG